MLPTGITDPPNIPALHHDDVDGDGHYGIRNDKDVDDDDDDDDDDEREVESP